MRLKYIGRSPANCPALQPAGLFRVEPEQEFTTNARLGKRLLASGRFTEVRPPEADTDQEV